MPDVSAVAALDVLIGLFFLYFVLSVVCSSVNEVIAQIANLRARDLEHGIRNLLADENQNVDEKVDTFFANWRIDALVKPGWLRKKRKPSYLPSRAFALAFLDTVAPPAEGVARTDLLRRARDQVATLPAGRVKSLLEEAIAESRGSIDRLRTELERSFNEVMDRASGWYKRRVQYILLGIAIVVAFAINADSFAIAQRLWKDDALRTGLAAQAQTVDSSDDCRPSDQRTDTNPVDRVTSCYDRAKTLGLPLGWTKATTPPGSLFEFWATPEGHAAWEFWEWNWFKTWGAKFLGLLVTAFALSLGAPFWFDLLGKVARLRATGPREVPSDEEGRARSAPERP